MKTPITFTDPSYAIFDIDQNGVRTTVWGGLAIFSTRAIAEAAIRQVGMLEPGANVKIVPVLIKPVEIQ